MTQYQSGRREKSVSSLTPALLTDNKLSILLKISYCAVSESSIVTCPYLMRSCAELSAPCSCLTVVAAWTEVGPGAVTGGDGPAVTAVLAPGSVFTVAAQSDSKKGKCEGEVNFNESV